MASRTDDKNPTALLILGFYLQFNTIVNTVSVKRGSNQPFGLLAHSALYATNSPNMYNDLCTHVYTV